MEPGEKLVKVISAIRAFDAAAVALDAVGVAGDAAWPPVDEHLRVAPGVWAVGDVTGKGAFTHVAMYQARIAVADILGQVHQPAAYHAVPRETFTDPEVGAVGLTEAQARHRGVAVQVGRAQIPSSARGWIHKAGNEGFVKLVADADRRESPAGPAPTLAALRARPRPPPVGRFRPRGVDEANEVALPVAACRPPFGLYGGGLAHRDR